MPAFSGRRPACSKKGSARNRAFDLVSISKGTYVKQHCAFKIWRPGYALQFAEIGSIRCHEPHDIGVHRSDRFDALRTKSTLA